MIRRTDKLDAHWRAALLLTVSAIAVTLALPSLALAGAVVDDANCRTNVFAANDDSSSGPVALPLTLDFYGPKYNSLWVNNNGNVTFTGPQSTFTPFTIAANTPPIIAPFFGDVDTRGAGSGLVTFGNTSYEGRPAFCVNWPNVGYYAQRTDKRNDFQLLLVDQRTIGPGDFDIVYNYDRVQWETGDASNGSGGLGGTSAGVGFSNGDGNASHFFSLSGSLQNGAFLDTNLSTGLINNSRGSNVRGRYLFQIRNGAPISNTRTSYVALGDSYSAGQGIEPFFDPSNLCHRSKLAYPTKVVVPLSGGQTFYSLRNTPGYRWGFVACSGAVTGDVLQKQLSGQSDSANSNYQRLGPETDLVTITVGGNDAKFADVLKYCYTRAECQNDPKNGTTYSRWLDGEVDGVASKVAAVYTRIRQAAPNARILVAGYPQVFPASSGEQNCTKLRQFPAFGRSFGYSRDEQNFLRREAFRLNNVIGRATRDSGVAEFVSVAIPFAGHEICGNLGEWINGPSLAFQRSIREGTPTANDQSFHPTARGQSAYADAINTLINPTF